MNHIWLLSLCAKHPWGLWNGSMHVTSQCTLPGNPLFLYSVVPNLKVLKIWVFSPATTSCSWCLPTKFSVCWTSLQLLHPWNLSEEEVRQILNQNTSQNRQIHMRDQLQDFLFHNPCAVDLLEYQSTQGTRECILKSYLCWILFDCSWQQSNFIWLQLQARTKWLLLSSGVPRCWIVWL